MSPFMPISVVIGVSVVLSHLTGNLLSEITGMISLFFLLVEYIKYKPIKDAEPDFMPGITDKIFFMFFLEGYRTRIGMVLVYILGLFTVVYTFFKTYGLIRL